jgi:hypothetical protein
VNLDTSFPSPIGQINILENGIVHVDIQILELTKEALKGHYHLLETKFGSQKQNFILTFQPAYLKMDAATRRYNNDMMNYWSNSMCAVVESPLIRTFVNMYIKINTLTYRLKVCKSMEEAIQFIENN